MSEIEKQEKRNDAFDRAMMIFDNLSCQGVLTKEEIQAINQIEKDYWANV